MATQYAINTLTIKGFKSIQNLQDLQLNDLNVLIGANGTGKSNFISYFRLLGEMAEGRLQQWTAQQGSSARIVSFGVTGSLNIESSITFSSSCYQFELEPTPDGGFAFVNEGLFFYSTNNQTDIYHLSKGLGQKESQLKALKEMGSRFKELDVPHYYYSIINNWRVYHFHDTSDNSGVKQLCLLHDNAHLRPDAANLAAFLYRLHQENPDVYAQIRKLVQMAIPFFDDFVLTPCIPETGEAQIRLLWLRQGNDYPLWPGQLSDGSIRFICLVTALLQPDPPSTIIIDEPELGLHPYALTLLAALLCAASERMQVIVSTQSVALANEFSIDDLLIVELEQGGTVFKRYNEMDFNAWAEKYLVGEANERNRLDGRPHL